ncbi:tyrosine-type recombinase/integrase [Actinomadura macra]|uniref:tyrosine-type recombinase/integrase n=1 Tax=Actinomadura macra TaxID=46164 RepID=UPI0012F8FE89|nr:tyrosine-type recombinase/integrase [Actinomadura macra]
MAAGDRWQDHDLVFAQWNGRPIDPRDDWEEWRDLLAEAGLAQHRVHAARHTAATIAPKSGVTLAVVSDMLGHSDIRLTRGYIHVASPLMNDGAARIRRPLLGGGH